MCLKSTLILLLKRSRRVNGLASAAAANGARSTSQIDVIIAAFARLASSEWTIIAPS